MMTRTAFWACLGMLLAGPAPAQDRTVSTFGDWSVRGEAAWAGDASAFEIVAAPTLLALLNHFKGAQLLAVPQPRLALAQASGYDLKDVKGQETAKRALEVTAAGGHNLFIMFLEDPVFSRGQVRGVMRAVAEGSNDVG
jgi:magnesium chelatase family protein